MVLASGSFARNCLSRIHEDQSPTNRSKTTRGKTERSSGGLSCRNHTGVHMSAVKNSADVVAVKDETEQRPIPTAWRAVLTQVVSALKNGDYSLKAGVSGVERPSMDAAEHIQKSIAAYGATLVELSEDCWESSVCMWYGTHWDALVDLWTEEEGRSDLVLSVRIAEEADGYVYRIYMVYVP